MGEAAYNLNDIEDLSRKEELSALEDQKVSSAEILKIRCIKGDLRQQINDAGDIFTEKDRERWQKEIENAAKKIDPEALKAVGEQIDNERKEIEKTTRDYVVQMEENREAFTKDSSRRVDTIKEYLDYFQQQPYEEKLRLKAKLQKDIDDRLALLEELKKLAPEREDEIQAMRRHERQQLKEELQKNMEPHQKAVHDFMAFPGEFRKMKRPDFMKLELSNKQKVLENMKAALNSRYENKISKAVADRILSATEIRDARSYFKEAPITGPFGRINAEKMLDSHLQVARDKTTEFADLIEELPDPDKDPFRLAHQYRERFYNSPYEVRSELCAKLKTEIDNLNTHFNNKYFHQLDSYRDRQIISTKTHREFMMWFSMQPLKDKPRNIELLGDDKGGSDEVSKDKEIKRYIDIFNEFRALPPGLQNRYGNEFYRGGYTARKALITKILETEKIPSSLKKDQQSGTRSGENPIADEPIKGINLKEHNDTLEDKTDEDLLRIIKKGENARAVLEGRMIYTTLNELAKAANDNALINDNKKDASQRDNGLTAEEAALQKELSDYTAGNNRSQKILKKNTNTGEVMAADVIKIDAKRIREKSPEEIQRLKRKATAVQHGGEKERLATSEIEFHNEGHTIGVKAGLEESTKEASTLDQMIINNASQQLGHKIDNKGHKRLLRLSKKRDKRVRLEAETT